MELSHFGYNLYIPRYSLGPFSLPDALFFKGANTNFASFHPKMEFPT